MVTLKPLRPLQFEGQNLYPLTTYDQIIMPDGKKWNGTAGADVVIEPTITSGTKLATISVDGVSKDLYYQASAVTLNGSATTSANFYAPTSAGTAGQVLKSNGSGAPSWVNDTTYSFTTGSTNGTIAVNGTDVAVKGLGSAAYTNADYYVRILSTDGDLSHHWDGYILHYSTAVKTDTPSAIVGGNQGTILQASPGSYYNAQFCIGFGSYYPAMRICNYETGVWGAWSKIYAGYADSAAKLATARTISLTGSVTGSGSFDGSGNLSIATTTNHTHSYAGSDSAGGAANSANWLNINSALVYGASGLNYFNASLGTTASASSNYAPTADWYHIIRMNHSNAQGYYVDLAACFHSDNLYIKRVAAGTNYGYKHVWVEGNSVTSAVWNDYAEYRESDCAEFGRVLAENGDDTLSATTERLQHFAGISSDTWGFCQGETEKAKTPIAVAGRVLAYTYRNRNEYKPGDCVCAAPNGTVDIMTREEIEKYPDRIVGTVSCVPEYEEWGQGDRPAVKVDGRIWIKVK